MEKFLECPRARRAVVTVILSAAVAGLLAGCDISDELRINQDGSGTYRATVEVGRLLSPILKRIRGEAEREGYRVVDEGVTYTTRYLVLQKDFRDIRELSGSQSNFSMKIEDEIFRRRYKLHATLGSVAGASFDRKFSITMPAKVTSSTDGRVEGRNVTWYCSNGGTIDVVAEGTRVALRPLHVAGAMALLFVAAAAAIAVAAVIRRRLKQAREGVAASTPDHASSSGGACRTCRKPMATRSRYCPSCGEPA